MENDETVYQRLKELQIKAIGYLKKHDFDRAIGVYLDIIKDFKDSDYAHQVAYSNLGVTYLNLEKPDLAEDYLKKALSYSPMQSEYHRLLGTVYILAGRPKEAIEEFRICVKQEPENEEFVKMLALALHESGSEDEAMEVLAGIDLRPRGPAGRIASKAAEHMLKGDVREARKLVQEARRIDPQDKVVKEVINFIENQKKAGPSVKPPETHSTSSVYQIKVTLKGLKPPIWRRFQVPGKINLYKLHLVLQALMGWQNYHLFEFEISDVRFSIPGPDETDFENARRYKLNGVVLEEKAKFLYRYDFGDGWELELRVEQILAAEPELKYPVCLRGRRAAPPEDCGGPGGYQEYLEILSTPPPKNPLKEDRETRERREWIGADFDPEYFEVEEINSELRKIKM